MDKAVSDSILNLQIQHQPSRVSGGWEYHYDENGQFTHALGPKIRFGPALAYRRGEYPKEPLVLCLLNYDVEDLKQYQTQIKLGTLGDLIVLKSEFSSDHEELSDLDREYREIVK